MKKCPHCGGIIEEESGPAPVAAPAGAPCARSSGCWIAAAVGGLVGIISLPFIAIIVIAVFVALGGPLKNMFENAAEEERIGRGHETLSAAIYE